MRYPGTVVTEEDTRAKEFMTPIRFFAPGIPRPGGSKRGFYIPKLKRVVITEDNKRSKDWRAVVAEAAYAAVGEPLSGALSVSFCFVLTRPKGHLNSKGEVRASAPKYPTVKPDATKLVRSTEDAMKGLAWGDDAQIVTQLATKRYGPTPGCMITIRMAGSTEDAPAEGLT